MVSVPVPLRYRARRSATRYTKNRGTDQANASLPKFPWGPSRVISFKGRKGSSHWCSHFVSVLLFCSLPLLHSLSFILLHTYIPFISQLVGIQMKLRFQICQCGRITKAFFRCKDTSCWQGITTQMDVTVMAWWEAAALAGMCVWLPENVLGVNMISWNRIWFLDCYLPRSWERLG